MTNALDTRQWVLAAVAGDVRAVAPLAALNHQQLIAAGFRGGDLIITRHAVRRVLGELESGQLSETEIKRWAWFVSRGYIPGQSDKPVAPLAIDYEREFEEPIVETIARFSELTDAVDGSISPVELAEFIRRLTS